MAKQYFMPNVANARLFDMEDNLIMVAKTLLDTTFDFTVQVTDVRAGKGNPLIYAHFHSPEGTVVLTDAQFNLQMLASTVGSTLTTGANVYTQEDVTLGTGGTGTVTGTPLAIQGTALYGWVTHDGVDAVERVTFTGSGFTSSVGSDDDVVCVYYFENNASAKQLSIYSDVVPDTLRLVLDGDLAEKSDSSAGIVGEVQIIVPKLQLDGNFSLAMTPDAVSTTPIKGRTISADNNVAGCSAQGILAEITRIIDDADWKDSITGLSILGGDITLAAAETKDIEVIAVLDDGTTKTVPIADLTYASSTVATATVVSGTVTAVATGTTYVSATVTTHTDMDASCLVTVS